MIPEQQQNDNEMGQFQKIRKKIKNEMESQSPTTEDLYPERQKIRLQYFLQSIKEYPKITAVMIEHQLKSIKTLPKSILDKFPEFNERVERSIGCCKKNAQFLQSFKNSVQNNLRLKLGAQGLFSGKQANECGGDKYSHSHSLSSDDSSKVLNLFNHLCRQFSEEQIHRNQRYFIEFIKSTITQYIDSSQQVRENMKTLVVGCGMGRSLVEIKQLYERKGLGFSSFLIQGHEQDPDYYLLAQYMLNHHTQTQQSCEIYPYIHNFSNHLQTSTPYTAVNLNLPKIESNPYVLTFGSFQKLYKTHHEEWTIIITSFYNYSIEDILLHIQLIYKLLRKGGLWIDISTASFSNHLIPYLSYKEYENILDKSQFKLLNNFSKDQLWYQEPNKLLKEWRKVHYRVMNKLQ